MAKLIQDLSIGGNLRKLRETRGLTQEDVCAHFDMDKGRIARNLSELEEKGLVNDQPGQGRLDIFTTGSTEEYTMKAAKVGLDPVTSVQFYPPMKL